MSLEDVLETKGLVTNIEYNANNLDSKLRKEHLIRSLSGKENIDDRTSSTLNVLISISLPCAYALLLESMPNSAVR